MNLSRLEPARACEIVTRFGNQCILVVGDVMLDRFIVGDVSRISPEAPVPVVTFASEHVRLGGAANVAHNVVALGGRGLLVGLVGRDEAAERLVRALETAGLDRTGLVEDAGRPTTEKVRIVTRRNQQIARIDYESDQEIAGPIETEVVRRVRDRSRDTGAFVVSDYLKGTVTRPLVEAILAGQDERRRQATPAAPVIGDPKIPHLGCYGGATLVTPNRQEAETATHRRIRSDADAAVAAREFRARAGCEAVIVTRGEHGLWVSSTELEAGVPAALREVADVTGAGDTVVATLALSLAAGATLGEAAMLANVAAGVAVAKFGAATVSADELLRAVDAVR
jgi:rfaE bifunctional protein kinase chain/domain